MEIFGLHASKVSLPTSFWTLSKRIRSPPYRINPTSPPKSKSLSAPLLGCNVARSVVCIKHGNSILPRVGQLLSIQSCPDRFRRTGLLPPEERFSSGRTDRKCKRKTFRYETSRQTRHPLASLSRSNRTLVSTELIIHREFG